MPNCHRQFYSSVPFLSWNLSHLSYSNFPCPITELLWLPVSLLSVRLSIIGWNNCLFSVWKTNTCIYYILGVLAVAFSEASGKPLFPSNTHCWVTMWIPSSRSFGLIEHSRTRPAGAHPARWLRRLMIYDFTSWFLNLKLETNVAHRFYHFFW